MYKTFGMQKGAIFKTNEILQGAFLFLCFQKYICFGIIIHEPTHLRCHILIRHVLYKSEISVILSLVLKIVPFCIPNVLYMFLLIILLYLYGK